MTLGEMTPSAKNRRAAGRFAKRNTKKTDRRAVQSDGKTTMKTMIAIATTILMTTAHAGGGVAVLGNMPNPKSPALPYA
jgi:hypothetical protein